MDISKILSDLRQEHERLGEAILSLERLAQGGTPRRGRPPAWIAKVKDATDKPETRRPVGRKSSKSPAADI